MKKIKHGLAIVALIILLLTMISLTGCKAEHTITEVTRIIFCC